METISSEQANAIQVAIRAASEMRECDPPIYPPLTAAGDRIDKFFDDHCRHLLGEPRSKPASRPDPVAFAGRLTDVQRAYVLALPVLKLSRWGTKVRAALSAARGDQ